MAGQETGPEIPPSFHISYVQPLTSNASVCKQRFVRVGVVCETRQRRLPGAGRRGSGELFNSGRALILDFAEGSSGDGGEQDTAM